MTIDWTGIRVGRLVALRHEGRAKSGNYLWRCRCDCGQEPLVASKGLKSGDTKSCGCLRREITAERGRNRAQHGHSRNRRSSPTLSSWRSMLARCQDETAANWHHYGGRGIRVCWRWLVFTNFLADMGERPPGTTIDRIDTDGHYEPANCRWSTVSEQNNNQRRNRRIAALGRVLTIAQWAREMGINVATIHSRLRSGEAEATAVTRPARSKLKG